MKKKKQQQQQQQGEQITRTRTHKKETQAHKGQNRRVLHPSCFVFLLDNELVVETKTEILPYP